MECRAYDRAGVIASVLVEGFILCCHDGLAKYLITCNSILAQWATKTSRCAVSAKAGNADLQAVGIGDIDRLRLRVGCAQILY